MKEFIRFICLFFAISCSTIARRNKFQILLENYLSQTSNEMNLISSDTFIRQIYDSFRNYHPYQYQALDNKITHYQAIQKQKS
jgi:hypothetical protein